MRKYFASWPWSKCSWLCGEQYQCIYMDDTCSGWRMALNETGFKAGWLSLPLLPRLCMRMDKNLELILWICNGLQQIPGLCQELSFEPLCFTTTALHWEQQFQRIRQRVTWVINNSVYSAHYMLCSVILNGQCALITLCCWVTAEENRYVLLVPLEGLFWLIIPEKGLWKQLCLCEVKLASLYTQCNVTQ